MNQYDDKLLYSMINYYQNLYYETKEFMFQYHKSVKVTLYIRCGYVAIRTN